MPIALLALAGFSTGAGMRLLDPLLPGIAGEYGIGIGRAALLVAGFMLPYAVVQIAAGPLGDRFGKIRIACVSLLLYAAAVLACAGAGGFETLLALRALSGLCAGAVIPLLLAHVGDTVPYQGRQAVIGRFLTGMVMSQLVAGPLSGALAEWAGWRSSFLVLGLFASAVALLLAARLGGRLLAPGGAAPAGGGAFAGYLRLLRRPAARRLLLIAALNGLLLFGGAFPFVASFLIEGFGRDAFQAGLAVAGFGVGAFVYTRLAGRLLARLGERGVFRIGGFGLAALLLALAAAPAWWMVAAVQLVMGLAFYMFHGVLQARATEVMPEARGTAVSAFALALFGGQAVGAVLFGLAQAGFGYRGAFAMAGVGMVALAAFAGARTGLGWGGGAPR